MDMDNCPCPVVEHLPADERQWFDPPLEESVSSKLSAAEERVAGAVRERRGDLLALLRELVACDTTARHKGDPARDEAKLQELLAARLRACGAGARLFEPPPIPAGSRFFPPGLDFAGRPQLVATLVGSAASAGSAQSAASGGNAGARGAARSLLLNGHIDAVDVEPRGSWSSDPFVATQRDGRLYGRGVADMKGGIAAAVIALEALTGLGVGLAGDIVFCTVTDEESSGAGGWSCAQAGVRADAGIAVEPTDFRALVACRGTLTPTITVEGRAGHAEMAQPHWSAGGAVNAIEKTMPVLEAISELREDWRTRPDHQHPLLSPGDIVPVIVKGGTWDVTYPASCALTCDLTYLPAHVDADGTGTTVEREVRRRIDAAVASDPWFAEHPLQWRWAEDFVPAEMAADHPLVTTVSEAAATLGRTLAVGGLDSWHDAATFTRFGTPTFSFGPEGLESAHTIDEWTTLDSLVDLAAILAVTAMRWCGVAS
jgi:acetylornithine deacetylase